MSTSSGSGLVPFARGELQVYLAARLHQSTHRSDLVKTCEIKHQSA